MLGSRLLGERERGAMPAQSVFGNRLACFLMRVFFGATYSDLGPFRAIEYRALEQLGMSDEDFGWTIEMQIKAPRAGLRTLEIPMPYRRRVGASKISGTLWGSTKAGILLCDRPFCRCRDPARIATTRCHPVGLTPFAKKLFQKWLAWTR